MTTPAEGPDHPVDQARRLAAERFPDALSVVLAGSTVAGRATATSDLDLAVRVARRLNRVVPRPPGSSCASG